MYGSKNILFMFPLFKKRRNHKFSNYCYPGSRNMLTSVKITISGQKCCRHLMQDNLKYLCAQFGYNWAKNKKMVKKRGGSNGPPQPIQPPKSPTLVGLKVAKFLAKISQFKSLVMKDKNIFVYKPFLSLNISDFSLFFYVKTATFLKKVTPIFPSNHPLRSWDLRTDILSSPSFSKI